MEDFDILGNKIVEEIGDDAKTQQIIDAVSLLTNAAGEVAQQTLASKQQEKMSKEQARAAGEMVWSQMKDMASKAGWPEDLKQQVSDVDKLWQDRKNKGGKDELVTISQQMALLTQQLASRAGIPLMPPTGQQPPVSGTSSLSFFSEKKMGVPVWGWGVLLAGLGGGLYYFLRKR